MISDLRTEACRAPRRAMPPRGRAAPRPLAHGGPGHSLAGGCLSLSSSFRLAAWLARGACWSVTCALLCCALRSCLVSVSGKKGPRATLALAWAWLAGTEEEEELIGRVFGEATTDDC